MGACHAGAEGDHPRDGPRATHCSQTSLGHRCARPPSPPWPDWRAGTRRSLPGWGVRRVGFPRCQSPTGYGRAPPARSAPPRNKWRRHQEFIRFLHQVEAAVPEGTLIHAILNNHATDKHAKVSAWPARHPHLPVMAWRSRRLLLNALTATAQAGGSARSSTCRPPSIATSSGVTNTPSPSPGPPTPNASSLQSPAGRICWRHTKPREERPLVMTLSAFRYGAENTDFVGSQHKSQRPFRRKT